MNWLYKLDRKYSRYGIPDLMRNVVLAMAVVFAADLMLPQINFAARLSLDMSAVMQGEVWRLVTFLFLPPNSSLAFIVISLYFYYMIGSALENEWGTFIFNVYYFIGAIGCIISALITGYADNTYLNLSLFFAFAILYPDFEVMLFFVLPVKVKYLAVADAVIYAISFIGGSASTRVSIGFSLAAVAIFFGEDLIRIIKRESSYKKTRRNFRSSRNRSDYYDRY